MHSAVIKQYSNNITVVFAGQMPPPVTGFAYITQEMARLISENHQTTIVDLSPHRKRGGLSYHFHRLILSFKGAKPLFMQMVKNPSRKFYVACEGDWGLVYTILLCTLARLFRTPTFIHHHSFGYIERHSALMAFLVAVAGRTATHIFLCQTMADRFVARYRRPFQTIVISNSAFVYMVDSIASPITKTADEPLSIGLLSNLNNDKGLGRFLDLLRQAAKEDLNISGILAGPPDGESERAAIDDACRDLGERLHYIGPVYADDKKRFFQSIDVFIFPTHYANEAQPTVVYEALASGVPVLSYDRGCILSQVGHCGAVQRRDEDFLPFAIEWLKERLADPIRLRELKNDAMLTFKRDHEQFRQVAATLFGDHAK